jgi:hypothetical protein
MSGNVTSENSALLESIMGILGPNHKPGPDDRFRDAVRKLVDTVTDDELDVSEEHQGQLHALVSQYLSTSRDINMQELLVELHDEYNLVGREVYDEDPLMAIIARVEKVKAALEDPAFESGGQEDDEGKPSVVTPARAEEDVVAVGSGTGDGQEDLPPLTPELDNEEELAFAPGSAVAVDADAVRADNVEYLVPWREILRTDRLLLRFG